MSYKDYIKGNIVQDKPLNDWERDTTREVVKPLYNDNDKNYNVSTLDVIDSINKSKHKLSGLNVWLPDEDGNLIPLPEWVGNQPGGGGGGSVTIPKQYRVELSSTQGNIIKDKQYNSTLKATVYENNQDVTDIKDKRYFKWARFSGASEADQIADAEWNLKWAAGAKQINITHEDVNRNAMFQVQFVTDKEAYYWEQEALKTYLNKVKIKEE